MSLIIDMLKDLDNRHSHGKSPVPGFASAVRSESRFNFSKQWLINSALIAFVMLAVVTFIHRKSAAHSIPLPAETPIVKTESIDTAASVEDLQPVVINGVSYAAERDTTAVTFQLNHESLYRLVANENHRTLTLYLDNATMQSDLPTLVGADSGIQSITAIPTNGNIRFVIHLKPGVTLQSTSMNKNGKTPELIITLANPALPVNDGAIKSTNSIKTPAMQTIVTEQYERAVRLAGTGNKSDAMVILNKLLRFYPDYNDARVALAAIMLETGNLAGAQKTIEDGLNLTPDYLPLIELKARTLTSEGKIKEALAVLQGDQPSINDDPNFHALLAALYNRQNNFESAASIYQELVTIDPHQGSWWFGLGVSLDNLGNSKDAVFAYTKAATEGRLNPQALSFLQTRLTRLREENHAQG